MSSLDYSYMHAWWEWWAEVKHFCFRTVEVIGCLKLISVVDYSYMHRSIQYFHISAWEFQKVPVSSTSKTTRHLIPVYMSM